MIVVVARKLCSLSTISLDATSPQPSCARRRVSASASSPTPLPPWTTPAARSYLIPGVRQQRPVHVLQRLLQHLKRLARQLQHHQLLVHVGVRQGRPVQAHEHHPLDLAQHLLRERRRRDHRVAVEHEHWRLNVHQELMDDAPETEAARVSPRAPPNGRARPRPCHDPVSAFATVRHTHIVSSDPKAFFSLSALINFSYAVKTRR